MSYYASWIYPVQFAFLPVYRLSLLLIVPATAMPNRKCSKSCAHGQCLSYVNIEKELCVCDSGWSGEECRIPFNCSCSSDSLCVGVVHNRSICLCPLDKFGPRCLLQSACHRKLCPNREQICILMKDNSRYSKCVCWHKFLGDRCGSNVRFEVSFSQILIPQAFLGHFIVDSGGTSEPTRLSTHAKIKPYENQASLYLSSQLSRFGFVLLFAQIGDNYYLLLIHDMSKMILNNKLIVNPSNHCPHIRQLVDEQTSSFFLLRRVKSYHRICQKHSNLSCFHDEEMFMCLCTRERHANCFHFDFNVTYDCNQLNDCQNNAHCFQDGDTCPLWISCVCPDCFYGSKCQFTTKGFSLTLDTILGYAIQARISIDRQFSIVKMSISIVVLMFVIGLVNGILSVVAFQGKTIREIGCGYYLLTVSIISLMIVLFLTLKFIFFLLIQMQVITNDICLKIYCVSMDFLLRSFVGINDWLSASIAIERTLIIVKGTSFNKLKSCRIARFVIVLTMIIVFGSFIHDPIHRQLVEDKEDDRLWCIVQYKSFSLDFFDSFVNIFHFVIPFSINILSAIIIMISAARQRAAAQKQITYREHLREQWNHHRHLLISCIVLIVLSIPRL